MKINISVLVNFQNHFALLILLALGLFAPAQVAAQQDPDYKSVEQARGLMPGDIVDDFSGMTIEGEKFQLSDELENGPVVVIFYRGQWCPICSRHLSGIQDSLELIKEKGATVIAISPEKPEYGKKTAEKTGAEFTLIYDKDYELSRQFDVLFLPDADSRNMYNSHLKANLKTAQSDDSERLPIPATFIINGDRKIVWRQFNPDYKVRATAKDILEHIPAQ